VHQVGFSLHDDIEMQGQQNIKLKGPSRRVTVHKPIVTKLTHYRQDIT